MPDLRGMREINDFLTVLPANIRRAAAGAGLRASAAPIRDQARVLAAKASGEMARSIETGSVHDNRDGSYEIRVRANPKKRHSFLAFFFEFGVAPHFLQGGDSGLSARKLTQRVGREGSTTEGGVLKIGDQLVSGAVWHPGLRPSPFLRPALDMKFDEGLRAFCVKVREVLERRTGFALPVGE